jgi:hypothetical protein
MADPDQDVNVVDRNRTKILDWIVIISVGTGAV